MCKIVHFEISAEFVICSSLRAKAFSDNFKHKFQSVETDRWNGGLWWWIKRDNVANCSRSKKKNDIDYAVARQDDFSSLIYARNAG